DSARLTENSKKFLNRVAELINADSDRIRRVLIEGHANELGSDAYNLRLSDRRASSVKRYLVSRDVPESKLSSQGFGKRRPRPGSDRLHLRERLEVNRRVELKATPAEPLAGSGSLEEGPDQVQAKAAHVAWVD